MITSSIIHNQRYRQPTNRFPAGRAEASYAMTIEEKRQYICTAASASQQSRSNFADLGLCPRKSVEFHHPVRAYAFRQIDSAIFARSSALRWSVHAAIRNCSTARSAKLQPASRRTVARPYCKAINIGIRPHPLSSGSSAFPSRAPRQRSRSTAFIPCPGVAELVSRSPVLIGPYCASAQQ